MVSDRISAADMVTLVQVSAEAQSTFAHLRSPSVAGVLSYSVTAGIVCAVLNTKLAHSSIVTQTRKRDWEAAKTQREGILGRGKECMQSGRRCSSCSLVLPRSC